MKYETSMIEFLSLNVPSVHNIKRLHRKNTEETPQARPKFTPLSLIFPEVGCQVHNISDLYPLFLQLHLWLHGKELRTQHLAV